MSTSKIKSSSTLEGQALHISIKLCHAINDSDMIHNCLNYCFQVLQTHQLTIKRHILSTSRDNFLSLF